MLQDDLSILNYGAGSKKAKTRRRKDEDKEEEIQQHHSFHAGERIEIRMLHFNKLSSTTNEREGFEPLYL